MASNSTSSPLVKGKQSIHQRRLLVVGKNLRGPAARGAFLESFGYQVVACASHDQAVRSLQSEVFDFVLLSQGNRSLLVALDWGRLPPAKVSVRKHQHVSASFPSFARPGTTRTASSLSDQRRATDLTW
jgi:hypothetical protein